MYGIFAGFILPEETCSYQGASCQSVPAGGSGNLLFMATSSGRPSGQLKHSPLPGKLIISGSEIIILFQVQKLHAYPKS